MKSAILVLVGLTTASVLGGCQSQDRGGTSGLQPDSAGVAEEPEAWRPLISQSLAGKSAVPVPFISSGRELRVITELGPLSSEVSTGLVISNLLPDGSVVPVASFRAQRNLLKGEEADTFFFTAPAGTNYLYIAEFHGLDSWTVSVEERI